MIEKYVVHNAEVNINTLNGETIHEPGFDVVIAERMINGATHYYADKFHDDPCFDFHFDRCAELAFERAEAKLHV